MVGPETRVTEPSRCRRCTWDGRCDRGRLLHAQRTAVARGRCESSAHVLVAVPAAKRLETHCDHAHVLPVPALHRHIRDVHVLHRRAAAVPGPAGRRHPIADHVRRPRAGRRGVRNAASSQAPIARDCIQRRHDRVASRTHCGHARVQGRPGTTIDGDRHADHGVRRVHVLRAVRGHANTVDTLW